MMIHDLGTDFKIHKETTPCCEKYFDTNGHFILKQNPDRAIYHTLIVGKNGFIHTLLTGTPWEEKDYQFYGERVYNDFIFD